MADLQIVAAHVTGRWDHGARRRRSLCWAGRRPPPLPPAATGFALILPEAIVYPNPHDSEPMGARRLFPSEFTLVLRPTDGCKLSFSGTVLPRRDAVRLGNVAIIFTTVFPDLQYGIRSIPVTNVTPDTTNPESRLSLVTNRSVPAAEAQASWMASAGRTAFTTADVSVPFRGIQGEANQLDRAARKEVEVTPFEHGRFPVALAW